MKKTTIVLTALTALSFGATAFAAQTYEEALHNRKQSVRDWETVISALRKAGVKDDSSAYKRVHEALKRNETRLKHLEKEGPAGFNGPHAQKAGHVASTAATAAAGTGILGKLGGLFGGSKEAQPEAVKAKPMTPTKTTKTVTKPAKKKAKSWGVRAKRAKKRAAVQHAPAKKK